MVILHEASRGAGAQTCDYKRDRLWVRFPLIMQSFQNSATVGNGSILKD